PRRDNQASSAAAAENIYSRKVSLTAKGMPLKEALATVAREAKVALQIEVEALKKVGLDVAQPVMVTIENESFDEALAVLINWQRYSWVMRELRGDKLLITTLEAYNADVERRLPDWLKAHYNRGLVARFDDGNVVSLAAGAIMSDELLARLKTL